MSHYPGTEPTRPAHNEHVTICNMPSTNIPESLQWEAYEHLHVDRTPDWFWGVGLSALALAVIAIVMKNITFAILIVVSAFVLTLRALKIPATHTYVLTRKGIIENDILHSYSELEAFWVDDENDTFHPKLLVRHKRKLLPLMVLPLGSMDGETVHNYLINFMDADRMEEPPFIKILEYLGF